MKYRTFKEDRISALAMGNMRLPVIDGDDSRIDEQKTAEMFKKAFDSGINYFDTAWGYHNGNSETVVGSILSAYPRKSYYLATKFPGYDLGNMGHAEEIFEKQLGKLKADYFDYYLFHNVCEMNIDAYLDDKKYGTYSYLMEQKKIGRIRHLGFSAHGDVKTIERFLEAYGKDMEFCQLQLNWLDWKFQHADEKVALLKKWNIPVWVMEPVRGGKLVNLPENYKAELQAMHPDWSIASWSFRYLLGIPEVTTVLSGMTSMEQLEDNIATFDCGEALGEEEKALLYRIADDMTSVGSVPCTACRYCTSHCPMELDIPKLIALYNEHKFTKTFAFIAPMAVGALPDDKKPSACIGCRSCESVCPQQIPIPDILEEFSNMLGLGGNQ